MFLRAVVVAFLFSHTTWAMNQGNDPGDYLLENEGKAVRELTQNFDSIPVSVLTRDEGKTSEKALILVGVPRDETKKGEGSAVRKLTSQVSSKFCALAVESNLKHWVHPREKPEVLDVAAPDGKVPTSDQKGSEGYVSVRKLDRLLTGLTVASMATASLPVILDRFLEAEVISVMMISPRMAQACCKRDPKECAYIFVGKDGEEPQNVGGDLTNLCKSHPIIETVKATARTVGMAVPVIVAAGCMAAKQGLRWFTGCQKRADRRKMNKMIAERIRKRLDSEQSGSDRYPALLAIVEKDSMEEIRSLFKDFEIAFSNDSARDILY